MDAESERNGEKSICMHVCCLELSSIHKRDNILNKQNEARGGNPGSAGSLSIFTDIMLSTFHASYIFVFVSRTFCSTFLLYLSPLTFVKLLSWGVMVEVESLRT